MAIHIRLSLMPVIHNSSPAKHVPATRATDTRFSAKARFFRRRLREFQTARELQHFHFRYFNTRYLDENIFQQN